MSSSATPHTSHKDSTGSHAAKNGKSVHQAKRSNERSNKTPNWFTMFAQKTAHLAGRPITFLLAVDPRASEFTGMKQQNLPPEHLFSRRADFLTFGMLGQLDSTNNWHLIAREWLYGDPPITELGLAHRDWLTTHPPKPVKKTRARKTSAPATKP